VCGGAIFGTSLIFFAGGGIDGG